MVDAITRSVLSKDQRQASSSHLIQSNASWIKIEADRLSWLDEREVVVHAIVEVDRGKGWQEVGRFGAHGGVSRGRDGLPITKSTATFRGRFAAGTLVRAVVDAKQEIETAVRLTWG